MADLGEMKTYRFKIKKDGTLSDRKLFYEHGSDGMEIDQKGNVYLTHREKVYIISKKGNLLETIEMPGNTTNVCFGGEDGRTLFITSARSIFSLKMKVKGQDW